MHITTHLLMANVLYKEINSQMEIELDYFHYVYGNIKPDVNPGIIDWPHFSHESLDDLLNYCEHITITPMTIKSFSVALGIVSHFICDYYCLYHTKPYRGKRTLLSIVKHTAYEHFLELSFIKKCMIKDIEVTDQADGKQISDMINRRLALYNNEKHSIDKDIRYAVNTAVCVLRRLIELSEIQKRQIADIETAYDFLKAEAV
ncbi:MAG: hypothetical protein K0S71_2160 [Clostridia bacterium]|jgi:hypothetical protein|nr:hypothetical protein [Clostridia bacterium]